MQIRLSITVLLLAISTILTWSIAGNTAGADNIGQNSTMSSDSTNMTSHSDNRQIIMTWLKVNETKPDRTSVISISTEDFWKTFEPLLKQTNERD